MSEKVFFLFFLFMFFPPDAAFTQNAHWESNFSEPLLLDINREKENQTFISTRSLPPDAEQGDNPIGKKENTPLSDGLFFLIGLSITYSCYACIINKKRFKL